MRFDFNKVAIVAALVCACASAWGQTSTPTPVPTETPTPSVTPTFTPQPTLTPVPATPKPVMVHRPYIWNASASNALLLDDSDRAAIDWIMEGTLTVAKLAGVSDFETSNLDVTGVLDIGPSADATPTGGYDADNRFKLHNNAGDVEGSLVSGAAASAILNFGDPDDEDAASLAYNNSTSTWGLAIAGVDRLSISASLLSAYQGAVFNSNKADVDFIAHSDTVDNAFKLDGTNGTVSIGGNALEGSRKNFILGHVASGLDDFGDIFLYDADNPTTTQTGGTYIRSNAGIFTLQPMRGSDFSGGGVAFYLDHSVGGDNRVGINTNSAATALDVLGTIEAGGSSDSITMAQPAADYSEANTSTLIRVLYDSATDKRYPNTTDVEVYVAAGPPWQTPSTLVKTVRLLFYMTNATDEVNWTVKKATVAAPGTVTDVVAWAGTDKVKADLTNISGNLYYTDVTVNTTLNSAGEKLWLTIELEAEDTNTECGFLGANWTYEERRY